MESFAKMTCELKVNFHCDGCKRKVMEVLQNLQGIYSVVIEAEEGTVKVSGRVDPTLILSILDRYKKHGEISSLRFDGELREERRYYPCYGGNQFIPYEPYPLQYPLLGGPEFQLHGRNQCPLLPPLTRPPLPLPPTYWPLPPPQPRAPQPEPPALPSPLPSTTCPSSSAAAPTQPAPQPSSAPQTRPAPQSSKYHQCCTTM